MSASKEAAQGRSRPCTKSSQRVAGSCPAPSDTALATQTILPATRAPVPASAFPKPHALATLILGQAWTGSFLLWSLGGELKGAKEDKKVTLSQS